MRHVLSLVLVACSTPTAEAPQVSTPATPTLPTCPTLPPGTVSSLFITLTDGSAYGAGKGALVDAEGQRVLLTAHHLFGPSGGLLQRQLESAELPTAVESVALHDLDTAAPLFRLGAPLALPGAAPADVGVDLDLAVVPAAELEPADLAGAPTPGTIPLAASAPKVDDAVCLYTSTPESLGRGHLARVTTSQAQRLHYRFYAATMLQGTDGAPVLNLAGELVGVQVSGKNGPPSTGIANPLAGIRRGLRAAGVGVTPAGLAP